MVFLKALIFILANIGINYLIILSGTLFLFNEKKRTIFKKRVPLTPGLIYRKKDELIKYLAGIIDNYLHEAQSSEETIINNWENKTYTKIWQKTDVIDNWSLMPKKIKNEIRHLLALLAYEAVKQFLRDFVPFLIEESEIKKELNFVSTKYLDVDLLKKYFTKYVYKYIVYFMMLVGFITGLFNMIIYLIVQ